ncbi:MAG: helix-turn-helix domain-containing protein [Oscillatoriophycideae cyanobacterium NC_groundwater_1537_Pr4_S-0.65um_50_18]|nr:helix-turn-helix domain-containing protein [Oscillatoriophycideae cyanobacterium NC_groundwater_1537_Pr4_S-0.65um_50_18]
MEKLDSAQLDQLKEIGTYLRQVRQEQSKSLEEIATKTCIRLPLLRAIELGQEQVLPEPVFVQGFIRRYADVLGLNGMDISRMFPVHSPIIEGDVQAREGTSAVTYAAPVDTLEESKYSLRSSREFSDPDGGFFRSKAAYALYAALGLAAIGGIAYAFFNPSQPQNPAAATDTPTVELSQPSGSPAPVVAQSPENPSSETVSETVSEVASPSPLASSPSPTASALDPNAPVKVDMQLTGQSWVQVLVDGEVQFEGMMAAGTQRSWSAKKAITVVAGNAGAVSVLANGGTATPMGSLGDVQEKTFTARTN